MSGTGLASERETGRGKKTGVSSRERGRVKMQGSQRDLSWCRMGGADSPCVVGQWHWPIVKPASRRRRNGLIVDETFSSQSKIKQFLE